VHDVQDKPAPGLYGAAPPREQDVEVAVEGGKRSR
jgi:hypothetical protein